LSVIDRRRLKAPSTHGAILAEPPLADIGRLLEDNRDRFNQIGPDFLGRSWADLRLQARREVLTASKQYLIEAGEPIPNIKDGPLFLAGHQPDLFHPGVWIKNFALCGLAKAHGAVPLNLIVDSDIAKTLTIRVPARAARGLEFGKNLINPGQIAVMSIPIDRWTREIPFEELRISDKGIFSSVANSKDPILQDWGIESIFSSFWQEVMRQSRRSDNLGECWAAARRTFERKWNCHNLELPVSRVCQTQAFAWFAYHLVAHLPQFHRIYNSAIRDYRNRYGLRSRSHPVPELVAVHRSGEASWMETPFWVWRCDHPRRRPLFARVSPDRIELLLDGESLPDLPRDLTKVDAWQELERQGIKIRSRALITTLFARLFLGELFIHGIGGGKYDELTDAIIRDFYQLEPPDFLVLSGTLQLPLPVFPGRRTDQEQLASEIRDLYWNPQRHLSEISEEYGPAKMEVSQIRPDACDLIAKKKEWIDHQPKTTVERRKRFEIIRELTNQLRPSVRDQERHIRERLEKCELEVHANAILQNREYAFCLHPEKTLRPFLTQFL
jgi:hypothetical protein